MEMYINAAEKIARTAIFGAEPLKPTLETIEVRGRQIVTSTSIPAAYDVSGLSLPNSLETTHRFPADGEYLFRIKLDGVRPLGSEALHLALWIDDKQVQALEFDPTGQAAFNTDRQDFSARTIDCRVPVTAGEHRVAAVIVRLYEGLPPEYAGPNPSGRHIQQPEFKPPKNLPPERVEQFRKRFEARLKEKAPTNDVRVSALEIGGPYNQPKGASNESLRCVYTCGHLHGGHEPGCARKIIADLGSRAFRHPMTARDVDRFTHLVTLAQSRGGTFDEGICLAVQAMLVSPHFLFRIEQDPIAVGSPAEHLISQYELASRLSYFLWSSMPDDALRACAAKQTLRQPAVLAAQIKRMLQDPRSGSLAENFGGQWLQFRALESVKPDKVRFPQFNDYLRWSMHNETVMFLDNVIRNDRPILDLIDGKYSFINQRLAEFYGIPGVEGTDFRRVDLTGTARGGVLTQGSVLTVTSYPNRTSPVLRGKWILENILNAPPPAPPPGVPNLDVSTVGTDASLRQQLEQHRKNPTCAACHARMDPLGFGLENFDAVGAWRTKDGKIAIDATGSLPDGRSFSGPQGLKSILMADRDAFAACVTSKLLTYALGRGLERYDASTVKWNRKGYRSAWLPILQPGSGYRYKQAFPDAAQRYRRQPKDSQKMNYLTRNTLSRRTLLRGVGAAIALPMLDAMAPALARASGSIGRGGKSPVRLAFAYVPNGIIMKDWTPKTTGANYELTRILTPLKSFRDDMMVLSGLADHNGNELGDGPGDHARAGASFLTGVHCKKTAGADIRNGISADQIAAQAFASQTRFASLELGCEDSRTVGNCDSGYSCAYTNSISWRSPTTPMPPEVNPRIVFERLFGTEDFRLDPAARARRAANRRSILDMVQEDTQSLNTTLGPADRRKMDEYLTSVREIEVRVQNTERSGHSTAPDLDKPAGVPVTFGEYVSLMFDLQVAAFRADLTRVSTMVIGREGSMRTYPDINISDSHHPLTHHRNNPDFIEKVTQINTFHLELFARYLGKLRSTADGDGSLLDNCMIVYGSGISDGNRHTHENLPILVAGRGGGAMKPGRHVAFDTETPISNLYMTLLDRAGVHPGSIGDSTGKLVQLESI